LEVRLAERETNEVGSAGASRRLSDCDEVDFLPDALKDFWCNDVPSPLVIFIVVCLLVCCLVCVVPACACRKKKKKKGADTEEESPKKGDEEEEEAKADADSPEKLPDDSDAVEGGGEGGENDEGPTGADPPKQVDIPMEGRDEKGCHWCC
jgi:hypothetical protein